MSALHKTFDFEMKNFDEAKRTFSGIASTPNQDRVKDVMVSKGASFSLPMPLLFHHDPTKSVGHVTSAKVTDAGIEVEMHIPEIQEEGDLKREVDKAFQSLKYKLVKGLSVGFIPNWDEAEMIKGGGVQFNKWEWYELSLVTIPCNRESEADFSKAFEEHQAALGKKPQNVPDGDASEQKHVVVKLGSPTKGGVKL